MESHVQMRLLGSLAVSSRSPADLRFSAVKQIYKPPSGVSSGLVRGRGAGLRGLYSLDQNVLSRGSVWPPLLLPPGPLQDARGGDVQTATH